MQLKRIKKIKSIGLFFDCAFGATDFPKTTLIYGLNGYGKSTLSDIFRSLSRNDPNVVMSKQTIHHTTSPECELCFSTNSSSKETNVCFKSGCWDSKIENIKIFDSRFVSENVYSDFEITHKHKENISALILGEAGSAIARDIANFEKDIREARKEEVRITNQIKRSFPNKYEDTIENFIAISEEKKGELKQKPQFQKELKTITEAETISGLKELKSLQLSYEAGNVLAHVEGILSLTPPDGKIDKEAVKKTQEYIEKIGKNGEQWLFQGLEYHKSKSCPFCTQNTNKVSDVISAYKNYFSNEYKTFAGGIEEKLNQYEQECIEYFNQLERQELVLSNNLISLNNIKDFITDDKFANYSKLIQGRASETKDSADKLSLLGKKLLSLISDKIEKKKEQPLVAQNLNEFDRIKFIEGGNDLDKKIVAYNEVAIEVNEKIKNLKTASVNKQNKPEIEQKIANLDLVEIRFSEALISSIKEYEATKKLVSANEKEREQKEKELAEYNKRISDKCLAKVNAILAQCGCRYIVKFPDNFNKKGYLPVLEIGFTLFGKDVPINKFGEVLSDSDKRVLALSFFIAQLYANKEELKETIVILDDPFTSFDDNRIEQVFTEIKKIATDAKQLIVLSHYARPLAILSEELSGHLQLKIKNSDEGSLFERVALKKLLSNPHEIRLDKLEKAISEDVKEENIESLKSDLRLVVEHEIKTRYRYQLKSVVLTTLGPLIDELEKLNNSGKISFKEEGKKVITTLREINKRTSKEHHSDPTSQNIQISTPEGIKTTIRNAFDLIYIKL